MKSDGTLYSFALLRSRWERCEIHWIWSMVRQKRLSILLGLHAKGFFSGNSINRNHSPSGCGVRIWHVDEWTYGRHWNEMKLSAKNRNALMDFDAIGIYVVSMYWFVCAAIYQQRGIPRRHFISMQENKNWNSQTLKWFELGRKPGLQVRIKCECTIPN